MGGEKHTAASGDAGDMGSPPHGRGKVDDPEGGDLIHRITPAWAGKSRLIMELCMASGDHPRMGGEKCGVILSL